VTAVSPLRGGDARVFGNNIQVTAVGRSTAKAIRIDWLHGTTRVPAQLGRDGAFVDKDYAKKHHLAVGSPIPVETPTGQVLQLRLKGIFDLWGKEIEISVALAVCW
jgi:putative ABC transport system permease protein